MRYRKPAARIRFKVPFGPWPIPLLGILSCILLLINTSKGTAIRFFVWMGVGHVVYFSYSFRNSKTRQKHNRDITSGSNTRPGRDIFVIPDLAGKNSALEVDAEGTEITKL